MLNLTLALAALAGGLGLEGLAAAMLLGRTVYASAIVVAAARGSGMADWPALLAQILLPLIWCAGVVWILGVAPVDGAIGGLATFVVYVLALLPLVPFGRVVLRGLRQSAPSEAGRG